MVSTSSFLIAFKSAGWIFLEMVLEAVGSVGGAGGGAFDEKRTGSGVILVCCWISCSRESHRLSARRGEDEKNDDEDEEKKLMVLGFLGASWFFDLEMKREDGWMSSERG